MNFEQPQRDECEQITSELAEESVGENIEVEKRLEALFGKSLRCFKRWGILGFATGALFIAGKFERQLEQQDKEWRDHVASTLDKEDLGKKVFYESQIKEFFGEESLRDIEYGDRSAYFENKQQERKPPVLEGFLEHGMTNEYVYLFDEKFGFYPKGWISGEVEDVEYIDDIEGILDSGSRKGGEFRRKGLLSSKIFLYQFTPKADSDKDEHFVSNEVVFHELGHANDWESDQDLTILERQNLLLRVLARMETKDTYDTKDHYHKSYLDGTKRGLYRAAKEYWADICAEYFCICKNLYIYKYWS